MTLSAQQKAKLAEIAKVPLLHFEWWGADKRYGGRRRRFVAYHRIANAAFLRVGRVTVHWRMPWLEDAARANHPELFQ